MVEQHVDEYLMQQLDPGMHFSERVLKSEVRQDGRGLLRMRKVTVLPNVLQCSSVGSALVKIGGTKVVAGITAQVGQPGEEGPKKGELGVEVHLLPLCNPRYTSIQAQHEEGKSLETFVQSVLLRNNVIQREDLCITEGRHVWKLNVDLLCLNHEGSLLDACLMAAMAALSNVTLPPTVVSKDDEILIAASGEGRTLQVQRALIPLTLGLCDGKIICDLTLAEGERIFNKITVVLDKTGQICALHKPGGAAISAQELEACISLCAQRLKNQ